MDPDLGREADLSSIADRVAQYASRIAATAMVPAVAIGLVTAEGLVEVRTLGVNHAGEEVTPETLFEIGSASKAFLGATEAILVDRGLLGWNDLVVDHYPAFEMHDPWVTQEFRIVDLLAQRSGLDEYAAELPSELGLPWPTGVAGLKYLEPVSGFRAEFAYQNMPHYIAGEIIAEKLGEKSWGAAASRLLFEPLQMTGSATAADSLASARDSTRGHTVREGVVRERPLEDFPAVAEGAGSIVSNLADMSKWIRMHLREGVGPDGRIISVEQLHETYQPRIAVTGRFSELLQHGTARPSIGYATGWFVHALPEGRIIEHGGNTEGYNSAVRFDPDRGAGIVVLTNQGKDGGIGTHLGMYAMDLIQGREPLDYHQRAVRQQMEAEATNAAMRDENAGEAHPIAWYEGAFEHPLLGSIAMRPDGDALRTALGPAATPATATRRAGSTFVLRWQHEGHPELEEREAVIAFQGTGDRADRFTMKGFTFTRTS